MNTSLLDHRQHKNSGNTYLEFLTPPPTSTLSVEKIMNLLMGSIL
jgi:hypothetical protein